MKRLQTNIKEIAIVIFLTLFPIITNAQKVLMVFSGSGVPRELTLVDSNGVRIGYSNLYNPEGILTMSLMYKNGVPNGQWSRYDDKTGQIKESCIYINGKLNGEHRWYDASGKIIKCIVYNNGIRVNYPQTENLLASQDPPTTPATPEKIRSDF